MNQPLNRELLIINASHYKNDGYTFIYNLNRQVDFTKPGSSISLYNLAMYNSTFNITSRFNNNTMSIKWIDNTVINIVIPDGYYSYSDISNIIEYYLIANNWYWISNNTAVYPISCSENPTRYAGQINIIPVPSSGITRPSGATWTLPNQPTTPQITFSIELGKIFGFSKQLTFPENPMNTNYSYVSDICPIVSPVYTYVITCSLLNTSISTNINNVLSQIPLNNSFGKLITLNSLLPIPLNIAPGKYSQIMIKFLDQNLNPINLIDPEITLILIIEY